MGEANAANESETRRRNDCVTQNPRLITNLD
jgi:hypothetical protein